MHIEMDIETICTSKTNHKHVAIFVMDIVLTNKTTRLWTTVDGEIKGSVDHRYVQIFVSAIRHYLDTCIDKQARVGTKNNPIIRGRLLKQIPDTQSYFNMDSEWI